MTTITSLEIKKEAERVLNKLTVLLHPESNEYVRCREIREAVEAAGVRIIQIYEKL